MEPILTISDGTRTVNLLDASRGFHLTDWTPVSPQMKDGGVFKSSPFSPGRSLVAFQYDNLYETFTVSVDGATQDTLIENWNSLIELLADALDYWISKQNNTPVYITARGSCETNTRYSVIKGVTFPTLINPYAPPFYPENGMFVTPNIPVVLETGIWTGCAPGSTICVPLSQDSTTLAAPGDCLGGAVLGNKHVQAQIDNAYHYDASVAAFSANLIGAAKPVALLPAVPAAGDILYVGIDNVGTSGPFSSVIFDIGTAATSITTMAYEYWNGAAWTAFPAGTYVQNEINVTFLTYTGVRGFYFQQPYNMATTAINGVTAYWVRFRVTAVGGAPTPMMQANRDIYTAIMPFFDSDSDDVPGTMDALARYILRSRSSAGLSTTFPVASEFLIGARSKARGSNFSAYINLGDSQNPTGVSVNPGVNTAFVAGSAYVNGVGSPSGLLARYQPGAAIEAYDERLNIRINPNANDWIGKYRVFLRYAVSTAGTGEGAFSIKILSGFSQQQSKEVVTQTTGFQIAQLGTIDLMTDLDINAIDLDQIDINIWVQHNLAVADILYLYDLILLPADEMLVQIIEAWSANNATGKSAARYDFHIDGATRPKVNASADQRLVGSNDLVDIWRVIAPDGIYAKHGQDTRYWLFQNYVPELVASPFLDIQPRYHLMRGSE